MKLLNSKPKKIIAGFAVAATVMVGGAVAANAAGGTGCRTLTYPLCARSVAGSQVVDNSLGENEFTPAVRAKLNQVGTGQQGPAGPVGPAGPAGKDGAQGPAGKDGAAGAAGADGKDGVNGKDGVTDLEADSPYPSATQLGDFPGNGANSTVKFVGDEGKTLQRAWVECADGKFAIGGGFQRADESVASIKNLQIVTSAATQVVDGKEVYNPIEGDKAGSVKPNAWLVEGFNNGTTDLIVRPSVVCAKTS